MHLIDLIHVLVSQFGHIEWGICIFIMKLIRNWTQQGEKNYLISLLSHLEVIENINNVNIPDVWSL